MIRASLPFAPLRFASVAVFAALAGFIGIGLLTACSTPRVREYSLQPPDFPPEQPALRIAFLSDIHIGNIAMSASRLSDIVDQVNERSPDVVLIGGDFIVGYDDAAAEQNAPQLRAPLSRLRAPLGVYAVLGNHDYWSSQSRVSNALRQAHVTVLDNQAVRLGAVTVIGISDEFSGHADIVASLAAARAMGGLPIVLTHTPDTAAHLPPTIPLVLAGHTHCGQIRLPLLGSRPGRSPIEHWKPLYEARYRCGVVTEGARRTIVTAGVGSGTVPIRIGAQPDWWLITVGPRSE